jgi:hypothetical protein
VCVRAKWLKRLFKPLFIILALPSLGCAGILALLVVLSVIEGLPSNVTKVVREQGKLAPLPVSASELRTYGGSSFFSSNA